MDDTSLRALSTRRWLRKSSDLLARLLAPYLFTLLAIAVAVYIYSDRVVEDLYVTTLSDNVLRQARLAADLLPWGLRGAVMDERCAAVAEQIAARVTVIAQDGVVLGDSDAPSANLENHGQRPEVLAAWEHGDGQAVRRSVSVNRRLMYRAWRQVRADDGRVEQRIVRLSVSMRVIDQARRRIRAAIWGGIGIAAIAALWPALLLSRRLTRRVSRLTDFSTAITRGTSPPMLMPERDDIVGQLEANVAAMANSLQTQLRAARAEQTKLEGILSGMVEGVLVVDDAGTIQLANERAQRLFARWPMATIVGHPLIDVSRDPDLQQLVREVTRGDGDRLVREITLAGDGSSETLHVTATPTTAADGRTQLFILVFHDITALKRLEATRRDFVANVSHELRTPLTAIRGYAETLREGALNDTEQARKFLEIIERHSERLSRLTEDLLTLSDLEFKHTPIRCVPMPLARALDAAVDVVREKAEQAQVEIRCELPPELPLLDADPDRIEQVLVNLIDNAVKFSGPGGRVTVSAHVAEPPPRKDKAPAPETAGAWVAICVADTGTGIPQHHLSRLTERFYRVDQARSRELGGTGLGLAIVKHIVQGHGGALHIESEIGRGTRVYVYLPVAQSSASS